MKTAGNKKVTEENNFRNYFQEFDGDKGNIFSPFLFPFCCEKEKNNRFPSFSFLIHFTSFYEIKRNQEGKSKEIKKNYLEIPRVFFRSSIEGKDYCPKTFLKGIPRVSFRNYLRTPNKLLNNSIDRRENIAQRPPPNCVVGLQNQWYSDYTLSRSICMKKKVARKLCVSL